MDCGSSDRKRRAPAVSTTGATGREGLLSSSAVDSVHLTHEEQMATHRALRRSVRVAKS